MGSASGKDTKAPQAHRVQLAATPIGPNVPGVPLAYHTSVAVDGVEFSFGPDGMVASNSTFQSHYLFINGPAEVVDCGTTTKTGRELRAALQSDFVKGTYDILKKNCNSFSECALFFLTGMRLDTKYRTMEQVGKYADEHLGLIRTVTMGNYAPNPKAASFDVDEIIDRIKSVTDGGHGQQRTMPESYGIGQRIEVYSATFKTWVGARVQAINHNGEIIVVYNEQKCRKTISAADLPRIVRPFEGVCRTSFSCDGWVRKQRCNSGISCHAPSRGYVTY